MAEYELDEPVQEDVPDHWENQEYHGSPSTLGRVIKLEAKVKQIQFIQYGEGAAIAICFIGVVTAARTIAKLVAFTQQVGAAMEAAAKTQPQHTTVQRPPKPTVESDIIAAREAVANGGQNGSVASTTGYDPGPQEVPDEVREALSRDTNLDELFNHEDT